MFLYLDLDDDIGLDTGLQPQLVCYMKSRLYEDAGNFEVKEYMQREFRKLIEKFESTRNYPISPRCICLMMCLSLTNFKCFIYLSIMNVEI